MALNQEVWQFLLAFLRMSVNFKFAFAEINFPPDCDILIEELLNSSECKDLQFLVVNLDSPDLLFVLEELKKSVAAVHQEVDKKLVLIVRGVEKSIGTNKDFPAVLTNLNYARDSFPLALPYPILFLLPEYAVNRLAQFAPDFWSWTTTNFKFQTTEEVLNWAMQQTSSSLTKNRVYAKSEQSARIDLLERLLQEYPEDAASTLPTRREILDQLGVVHRSVRDFQTAKEYFEESLGLSIQLEDKSGEASVFYQLGCIFDDLRRFDEAMLSIRKSLSIRESIEDRQSTANSYHMLGNIALKLRKWDDARHNYMQALAIKVEFADRYSQASTYHQLGIVAQELREWDEARHNYRQALAIDVEFADRYSQASTYYQLGRLAEDESCLEDAVSNFTISMEIWTEFQDEQWSDAAQSNLDWVQKRLNLSKMRGEFVESINTQKYES